MNRISIIWGGVTALAAGTVVFHEDLENWDNERRFGTLGAVTAQLNRNELEISRYDEGFEMMNRKNLVNKCRDKVQSCIGGIHQNNAVKKKCGNLVNAKALNILNYYKEELSKVVEAKKSGDSGEVVNEKCLINIGREINRCQSFELQCLKGEG